MTRLRRILRRDPGVVHQDVDSSESGQRLIDGGGDLRQIADVHLERERRAAQRAHGLDDLAAGGGVTQAKRNVGAGISQRQSCGSPEPLAGAGDEGYLVGQIEAGKVRHG